MTQVYRSARVRSRNCACRLAARGRRLSASGAIARSIRPTVALSGREVGSLKLANGAPRKNPGAVLGGARRGSEGLHPGGQSEDEMHAYDTSSDLNSQLDGHRPRRLARM